jgi:hypothetical protein
VGLSFANRNSDRPHLILSGSGCVHEPLFDLGIVRHPSGLFLEESTRRKREEEEKKKKKKKKKKNKRKCYCTI